MKTNESTCTNSKRKRTRHNSENKVHTDVRREAVIAFSYEEGPISSRKCLKMMACHSETNPPSPKHGNDKHSVDEIDGIVTMERSERILTEAPKGTPASFNGMTPTVISSFARIPVFHPFCQKAPIYIQHEDEEKSAGDDFGAKLSTERVTQKDGNAYNRHFLIDVMADGPAAKMKIHNWDEIVLLNSIFVPYLTHDDVLNTFHKVQVDGRTRFQLIIRRCIKVGSKEQWEWIDTSAILSPDVPHNPDYYPKVEEARFKELPGNVYEIRSVYFYKIPGTQCYLDVRNEFVVADAMSGTKSDKTKRICKILRYKMKSDNTILYTAALCAESKMRYIGVGQGNQVKLDENPFWFEVKYIGDNIKFKTNEMFLACNTNTFKTEVHRTEYWFEEFLADEGQDHPDCVEMPCGDGISLPLSRNISSDESSCSNGMSRSLCRCLSLSEYVG